LVKPLYIKKQISNKKGGQIEDTKGVIRICNSKKDRQYVGLYTTL
jgi:hypothetical protein